MRECEYGSDTDSDDADPVAAASGCSSRRAADAVFTPERLTEEHRLIAQTAEEFVDNEVLPELDRLEQKDWALARELVKRCGDLGLLGVDVPEAYGGVGLDKVTSLIVSEQMARSASFGADLRRAGQPDDAPADAVRHARRRSRSTCRGCCPAS